MSHRVFLSLGSNVGDSRAFLATAVAGLVRAGTVVQVSSLYETDPWGGVEQDPFLNLVVELDTELEPLELLACCQQLEAEAARVRTIRWGPRTLDVDVLLYDQLTLDLPELTIPHPRMEERAFVTVPLAEVAPELAEAHWTTRAGAEVRLLGRL